MAKTLTNLNNRKSRQEIKATVATTDPLADYENRRTSFWGELIIQGLPPWYLWIGRAMLDSDPLVRFAINVRNAALMPAEITVKAKNEMYAAWIQKQWDFLWNHHRSKFTSAKKYGFSALQAIWKLDERDYLTLTDCKDYSPEDAKCLVEDNRIVGMTVKGKRVFSPQALWMTFGSEFGNPYGTGILRRMYPAWFEKWMNHGAKKLLQLRMLKDAYIGDIFWYPPDQIVEIPDGQGGVKSMPWRDVFREIGENRTSGNVLTLPLLLDSNGKELTRYTPPQDTGSASQIFEWNDLVDSKILQAADVPREVIEAAETGSGYSGRSIPFLTMLSVCNDELVEMVQCFRRLIEPVIWLNWGVEPDFEIIPSNLVETFSDDTQGSPMGGGAIGGQPGQQPPVQLLPAPQQGQQFEEEDGNYQYAEVIRIDPSEHKAKGYMGTGPKYTVLKNPSLNDAKQFLGNSKYKEIRGIRSKEGHHYIWDASHADHKQTSEMLGHDFYDNIIAHGERIHANSEKHLEYAWPRFTGTSQHAEKPGHVEGIYHADQVDDKDQHTDFHRIVHAHGGKSYELSNGKHLYGFPAKKATSGNLSDFHAALEDNGHSPLHHQMQYDHPDEHTHYLHRYGYKEIPAHEIQHKVDTSKSYPAWKERLEKYAKEKGPRQPWEQKLDTSEENHRTNIGHNFRAHDKHYLSGHHVLSEGYVTNKKGAKGWRHISFGEHENTGTAPHTMLKYLHTVHADDPQPKRIEVSSQHAEKQKMVEGIFHADHPELEKEDIHHFHQAVANHGGKVYKLESGKHLFKLPANYNTLHDFHAHLNNHPYTDKFVSSGHDGREHSHDSTYHQMEHSFNKPHEFHLAKHGYTPVNNHEFSDVADVYQKGSGGGKHHYTLETNKSDSPFPYWYHQNYNGKRSLTEASHSGLRSGQGVNYNKIKNQLDKEHGKLKLQRIPVKPSHQFAEAKKYVEGIYHADKVDDKAEHDDFHRTVAAHGGKSYALANGKHLYKLPADMHKIREFHAQLEDNGHSPQNHQLQYEHSNQNHHTLLKHGFTHAARHDQFGADRYVKNPRKHYEDTKVDTHDKIIDTRKTDSRPETSKHLGHEVISHDDGHSTSQSSGSINTKRYQYPHQTNKTPKELEKYLNETHGKPILKPIKVSSQHSERDEDAHQNKIKELHKLSLKELGEHRNKLLEEAKQHREAAGELYRKRIGGVQYEAAEHKANNSTYLSSVAAEAYVKHPSYDWRKGFNQHEDSQHAEQFGEHSYCSTQFNLSGSVAEEIKALGLQIPDSDLTEDGRENEIHVTLLWGIH